MPAHRLSMRKTREILRLRWGLGLSRRQVGRSCSVSPSTVADIELRAKVAGLTWPLELTDLELDAKLYPPPEPSRSRALPNFAEVYRELKRPGVTLQLVWQEYRANFPDDGYGYSRFCDLFRDWRRGLDVVMRQEHRAGDKLFVDFAGQTVPIIDPKTGEVTEAQIFVAALGASNYTYAEACASQASADWLQAHVNAFNFFGGVTAAVVPDNLKSGVTKPNFYEPDTNASYGELAEHYGTVILPARIRKPRDKAKVENAVQQAERWLLAPLRNQEFFSLAELNQALAERLEWLNNRPFQKLEGCRRSMFEEIDKPALRPLPTRRYELAEWKTGVGVNIDYHVELDRHFYSVPHQLVRKRVDIRATNTTVECLFKGQRVASHRRSFKRGYTTLPEHMPRAHREYAEWTPSRVIRWAESIGPSAAKVVRHILEHRPHPEQGFRSCLGIIRLGKKYGNDRVEAACRRADAIGGRSYKSVESILKTGFDQQPLPKPEPKQTELNLSHENVRGSDYYH